MVSERFAWEKPTARIALLAVRKKSRCAQGNSGDCEEAHDETSGNEMRTGICCDCARVESESDVVSRGGNASPFWRGGWGVAIGDYLGFGQLGRDGFEAQEN